MSAVFSKPKAPPPPEPIKVATKDDAIIAAGAREKVRSRKGRASTILSKDVSRTQSASKTLLGN
jgi:hypothetical protein